MVAFANSAKLWLDADPLNVVTMHCKAGKGRAGLMCCVLLIRSGVCQSAKEALDLYDRERVTNNRGLTVCSQRKFVIFYEALWRKVWKVEGNIGDIAGYPVDSPIPAEYAIPKQPALSLFGVEVLNVPAGFVQNFRVTVYQVTNFLPILLHDSGYLRGDSLVVGSPGGFTDFPLDQLDMKKKLKPKLGEIICRLNFIDAASVGVAGPTASKGYELVAVQDVGIEMTGTTGATRDIGSGETGSAI
eukprot:gene34972-43124_t